MSEKPKSTNSLSERELDKAAKTFDKFDQEVKNLTLDRMNESPRDKSEMSLSQKEIQNSKDIYLKPERSIGGRDKFNEEFRDDYEFSKEYVHFVAEHKEIPGDTIEVWTRPFGGMPAEFWKVPSGKPVWGPRYLAEQLKRKFYHRLKTDQGMVTSADGNGQYYGSLVVDSTVARLDAQPVSPRKSIFMGSGSF